MHAALDALLRLVLPVDCAGCGSPGAQLCAACRAALAPSPRTRTAGGLAVTSALDYAGPVREAVIAFKNEDATALAGPLAAALRAAVATALGDRTGVALVPVPRTRRSAVERGYDPVRLLLRRADLPHRELLRLVRRPGDQLRLGRDARFANVAAGTASTPATGMRVLLVDDVVTTGATLAEAARAVRAAGGAVVGAATVASTPRGESRARRP